MTNKKFWLETLAAVLVFGIVVIGSGGCGSDPTDSRTHSIKVTGIPEGYDRASFEVRDAVDDTSGADPVATGSGSISGDSVTVELYAPDGAAWYGSGAHYLTLLLDKTDPPNDGSVYLYTAGKTLAELGISESDSDEPDSGIDVTLPAWGVTGTASEIPFTGFVFFHGAESSGPEEPEPGEEGGLVGVDLWAIDTLNWMSKVPDGKSIKDMAIPGTHDSGTYKMITGETQCQWPHSTIANQLEEGIRYFDLRIGYHGQLYHGDFAASVWINDVVDTFIEFLNAHPTETILASFQWEGMRTGYTWDDYRSWCAGAFAGSRRAYWHFSSSIPLMGQVRGKIVLINCDQTGEQGLNLDNDHGNDFVKQNSFNTGDWWQTKETRARMKYGEIWDFMDPKKGVHDSNKILWNGWNHQFNLGVSVRWYADTINNYMWYHWTWDYPRGIQLMDFLWSGNVRRVLNSGVNYN